jgi:tetratricopeptide (TPR) repeat protein
MPVLGKKTRFIVKFLMVIFSVLVTLVGLEVLIRWDEKIFPIESNQASNSVSEIKNQVLFHKSAKNRGISASTFNIYYFGESSMWGEPYVDTIPILVEKMLQGKIDGKELKWINMAAPGWDINEVSNRIKMVVDQKNVFFPSLVVIYAGHNEFLSYQDGIGFSFRKNDNNPIGFIVSRSRLAYRVAKAFKLYKLQIDDRAFFDVPVVSMEKRKEILNSFNNTVQSTISYLRNNEVPMIISTEAGNYADFEPNRSVFTEDETKKEEFKKNMDEGVENQSKGKIDEALINYEKALEIDNKFAETYYRLGQVYQKLGQNEKAWEAYSKAVDYDMMPIRATSFQNDFIRKLNEDDNTKVIDTVSYLRENSKDTLIGNNFMADGHHPNLKGFLLISELYAKKIASMYLDNTKFVPLPYKEADKMFNTKDSLFGLNSSRATWLIRLATWRYDPTQRLTEADSYIKKAISIYSDDYYSYSLKMTISYLRNNIEEAKKYFEIAKKLNHKAANMYLQVYWVNQIITRALNEN